MNRAPPAAGPTSPAGQSVSPPKSSVWSGMSVVSDEEDSSHLSSFSSRLSTASVRSSVSGIEALTPEVSSPQQQQQQQQQSTFELSPFDSSPGPRIATRKTASARKLDFDEAPPVSAASSAALAAAPALLRQKSAEHIELTTRCEELSRLLQGASARAATAEQQLINARAVAETSRLAAETSRTAAEAAQKLLVEREKELEELRAAFKARERADEDARSELEEQLREARARRAMAEEELSITLRELQSRDMLVAELRGQSKPVSAELSRMAGSKQADVVAFLSRELDHEKVPKKENVQDCFLSQIFLVTTKGGERSSSAESPLFGWPAGAAGASFKSRAGAQRFTVDCSSATCC